jgi:hypothetical protein
MFAIEVNGNRLHDEGEHDAEMRVVRAGGGPLVFATEAEASAHAEALHARVVADFTAAGRGRYAPKRDAYKVVPYQAPPDSV